MKHNKLGTCDTNNNITFRCDICGYALTTCGDCFPDETYLTDEFMKFHFGYKIKSVKAGDCFSCCLRKKSGTEHKKRNFEGKLVPKSQQTKIGRLCRK